MENLGNLIVLAAALLAVGTATARTGGGAAGLAGFSLSFALAVTSLANFLVRSFSDLEQQLNAVERCKYYIDTVPQEEMVKPQGAPVPPPSWPFTPVAPADGGEPVPGLAPGATSGAAVVFTKYAMRYRPSTPEVLHGVSFAVRAGERIGVVGRTGSGKSSLLAALFRLIGDDCHSGTIGLGGVDIDSLGLRALRTQLAIIPQVRAWAAEGAE